VELTGNMGLGGFNVFWLGEMRLGGAKAARAENCKLKRAGSKGRWFGVYSTVLENPKWKFQIRRQ
jgi:hypothetical protein